MTNTSDHLNAQQQQIIDQTLQNPKRHLMVVAGPGTGKTEVLILRAQALLETGLPPSALACISFTQASTHEIRGRLTQRTHTAAHQWHIYTFHSFFLHLLRSQVQATPFQFVTPSVWEHHFLNILIPSLMRNTPPPALISKSDIQRLALEMLSFHHTWLLNPPADPLLKWISSRLRQHYTTDPCPLISVTDIECFFWLKLQKGKIPFFPYEHVLIDEFQDTSKIQYDIIHTYLTKTAMTIFAVGDAKQSIYAFRRARVENFEELQHQLTQRGGLVIYLTQNYRSSTPILGLANRFQKTYLNHISDPELQSTHNDPTPLPEPQFTPLDQDSFQVYLSQRCRQAFQEHQKLAILFRTQEELKALHRRLPDTLLPHVKTSHDHTIAYLQSPFARGLALGFLSTLFPKSTFYKHAWETSLWTPHVAPAVGFSLDPQNTLSALLASAQTTPYLLKDRHAVHILMSMITEAAQVFLPHFPYQLENYLLSLLDPFTPTTQVWTPTRPSASKLPITLSTLHGAKGLEFDHVIVAITSKSIPKTQSYPLILEEHSRWGIRYRPENTELDYTFRGQYEALQQIYKERQLAEEFRLLYVGITRAKQSLEICFIETEIPKPLQPWLAPQSPPETLTV